MLAYPECIIIVHFYLEFHHEFVFSPATPLGFEDSLSHWKGPHPWPFSDQLNSYKFQAKWLKFVQFREIGCKKLVGDFWDIQYRKQEAGQSQKAGAFQGIVLTFQRWRCVFSKTREDLDGIWEWPSGMTSGCYQVHKSWPQPQPKMANRYSTRLAKWQNGCSIRLLLHHARSFTTAQVRAMGGGRFVITSAAGKEGSQLKGVKHQWSQERNRLKEPVQ